MTEYKEVPIEAAKRIAEEFDKSQVIIVCWDPEHCLTHVTTYGKSLKDCEEAAMGGDFVREALGVPEEDCHVTPNRLKENNNDNKPDEGDS